MILHAYVDVYVLCVCIVGHGYTTTTRVINHFLFFPQKIKESSIPRDIFWNIEGYLVPRSNLALTSIQSVPARLVKIL